MIEGMDTFPKTQIPDISLLGEGEQEKCRF